jgi:biotin carboxyl carrier protein
MKKKVHINNTLFEAEVKEGKNGTEILINETLYRIDLSKQTHSGYRSIIVNGKSFEVYCEELGEAHFVLWIGHNSYDIRFGKALGTDSEEEISVIHAPMPGLIAKLNVKEKDSVLKGDPLLILEAMKMQNELKSPKNGTIKEILVQEGTKVGIQDRLIILE